MSVNRSLSLEFDNNLIKPWWFALYLLSSKCISLKSKRSFLIFKESEDISHSDINSTSIAFIIIDL
jgi:hypothetical protein